MLHNGLIRASKLLARRSPTTIINSRTLASRASQNNVAEDELSEARRWLANFDPDTIPKNIVDVSFSRSSGPGGQNVNKVNSKATLKISLSSLLPLLPSVLRPAMQTSRYCAPKSDALVIQADDSRKQGDNIQSCYAKLHDLIIQVGRDVVPGETSQAQSDRVVRLQKTENEARLRLKKRQSDKKSARRSGGRSDY